jgi:hypothetical protein
MAMNNNTQDKPLNIITRIWRFLTEAHPSVTDVGERRRAQLLSALSLILFVSFTWALLSAPRTTAVFIIFLGITWSHIFSHKVLPSRGVFLFIWLYFNRVH